MEKHRFNRWRLFLMVALIGIGLVVLLQGGRLEMQNPRSNEDDVVAWWVLATGMFLIGAGVGFAFGRPILAILVGIAFPVLAWPLSVLVFWACLLHEGFDHIEAVRSGYRQIPEARQIDDLIGTADHTISSKGSGLEWCTEAYFGGRYELAMTVDVQVDKRTSQVTSVSGQPTFYLQEIEKVDLLPGGRVSVSYRGSGQREFGAAEWKKVVEAMGDFSVIGIQLMRNSPVPNFDRYVEGLPHQWSGP